MPAAAASEDPDAADVRLARDGDRVALERLVVRNADTVSRLLWRFVRTKADLDDLVQETFVRMVRGLPSWRADQPFAHWLLRIATNVGRDSFRRQAVRRRWSVDPLDATTPGAAVTPDVADPAPDPAARLAHEEVKALLAELSPDERTILTLHHLEGWGLAEIAARCGWTLTATKLRAWRARRQLRTLLERDFPSSS